MRCLTCRERLLAEGAAHCPKCGRMYDSAQPESFGQAPPFSLLQYWLPGFLTALFSGVLAYGVCLTGGDMGVALFCAVPISAGAVLGYATKVRYWLLVLLALALTGSMALMIVAMNFAGFFCGMTLSLIFAAPIVLGMCIGLAVRYWLIGSQWRYRWYLPLVLFVALPYVAQWVESSLPRRREIATVRTTLHVHATPQEAWDAIQFYEQVSHSPPLLLHLALPRPIDSVGRKDRVGEIVRCRYDRGWLTKRISRVEPGRLLEFEVIEQHLHFERDVTLTGGSFQILPQADGTSRIELTTRYQRHLRPAIVWRPMEETIIHTLHGHVL
ncbi:MAG: SRPBCC family protein, partial [Planctomycetales bacterium]|nr:SRPBCC family protein [Planctomycetales bacterium]